MVREWQTHFVSPEMVLVAIRIQSLDGLGFNRGAALSSRLSQLNLDGWSIVIGRDDQDGPTPLTSRIVDVNVTQQGSTDDFARRAVVFLLLVVSARSVHVRLKVVPTLAYIQLAEAFSGTAKMTLVVVLLLLLMLRWLTIPLITLR